MLNPQTISKIEEFVHEKPRSIQEIAAHIGKNWRTADRYVDEIEKNFGTISTRVFRGGTRGALKIVYWSSVEKVSHSIFQERLEKDILSLKKKEDFSPFDIFQYVPEKNRSFTVLKSEEDSLAEFVDIILGAKKQILFFSGNLSFINLTDKRGELYWIMEELVKRKVSIKILCRVGLNGKENVERVLSLNAKYGKELIEVRHDAQPIRGLVIDGKFMRLKERKEPTKKVHELKKSLLIFYNVYDKEWVDWISRIFWKKFSNSMDAHKRLELLKTIKL
ncbi:MAG: hypothetical protein ACP5NW_05300 [Candidatus Woesearchaeota archaeon]